MKTYPSVSMSTLRTSLKKSLTLTLAALAPAALAGTATAGDTIVVEAGKVITMAGEPIEDGVIVIQNGRIAAVGKRGEVETPWDAPVIGGPDLVAFPGFVESHTSRGLDRPNENIDVAPFLDLRDSVDPVNFFFEDCLRYGTTTVNLQHGSQCVIGARGMIVRPTGMTVEEMTVRPANGLKLSASPKSGKSAATQAQALRGAFDELRRYLEDVVQEKKDGKDHARREALYQGRELEGERAKGRPMGGSAWKVDGLELVPRGEIDEKQEPLLELIEGRYDAYLECRSPQQVHLALEVAKANGLAERSVLVLYTNDTWKAADAIKASGCPVILHGPMIDVERNPNTGEETEVFVPGVFAKKGIPFALSAASSSSSSLGFAAAMATGLGLTREQALAAVTTTAADAIGLGDRIGSLEPGKDGNVVLFSGDPLSITSWVEHVVIEGSAVYDRSTDIRNKHLVEGEEPRGTAPVSADEGEGDGHGDSHDEDDDDEDEKDD